MEKISDQGKLRTIAEVATQFHVSYRTLRFYEQMGLISPQRTGTRRLYAQKDVAKIAVILQGRHLGFSLSYISDMLSKATAIDDEGASDWVLLTEGAGLRTQIAGLQQRRDQITAVLDELSARLRRSEQTTCIPSGVEPSTA